MMGSCTVLLSPQDKQHKVLNTALGHFCRAEHPQGSAACRRQVAGIRGMCWAGAAPAPVRRTQRSVFLLKGHRTVPN